MVGIINRVCEETISTGTGTLQLNGISPIGYTNIPGTLIIPYLIEAVDALGQATGQWETGLGWKNISTGVFTRLNLGYYTDSAVSSPVDFGAGTKRVWLCYNDLMTIPWIAIGSRDSGTQTMSGANTTPQLVQLIDLNNYSIDFTTLVSNCVKINTEMISGSPSAWVSAVELEGQVTLAGMTAGEYVYLSLKQGSSYICDVLTVVDPVSTGYHVIQLSTPEPEWVNDSTANFCMYVKSETTSAVQVTGAQLTVKAYQTF